MARLAVSAVDAMMAERPDSTLEAALDVFEVFASGSLTDEVYILEDVAGKRIAIAPTAVRDKYRRGGPPPLIFASPPRGAGGAEAGRAARHQGGLRAAAPRAPPDAGRPDRAAPRAPWAPRG